MTWKNKNNDKKNNFKQNGVARNSLHSFVVDVQKKNQLTFVYNFEISAVSVFFILFRLDPR